MRNNWLRIALIAVGVWACEESTMQDVAGLSGDSAHLANEFSAADRRRVADALMAVADTGHCQVLHLFGSPGWVETGVCVTSNGAQCRTGHPTTCFKGR